MRQSARMLLSVIALVCWPITAKATPEICSPTHSSRTEKRQRCTLEIAPVLFVSSTPMPSSLKQSLAVSHRSIMTITPKDLPSAAEALQAYSIVILNDVPARSLSAEQMQALNGACKESGVGCIIIGGEQSFSCGGYSGTPLEAMLPVSVAPPSTPSLAVVLVIEEYEGPLKIDWARLIARATVDLLGPKDQFGVLDCNGLASFHQKNDEIGNWRIPLKSIEDRTRLFQKTDKMTNLGDPPTYLPYLAQAVHALRNSKATQKHIILVGDGDAVYERKRGEYVRLLRQWTSAPNPVSISTIIIAPDENNMIKFMAALAFLGKGDSWAPEPNDIPRFLVRDLSDAGKQLVYNRSAHTHLAAADSPLASIDWKTAPALMGYNLSKTREGAAVWLASEKQSPLCAAWNFGKGRVVAFLSDDGSRWASKWKSWPGQSQFWLKTLSWTSGEQGIN